MGKKAFPHGAFAATKHVIFMCVHRVASSFFRNASVKANRGGFGSVSDCQARRALIGSDGLRSPTREQAQEARPGELS